MATTLKRLQSAVQKTIAVSLAPYWGWYQASLATNGCAWSGGDLRGKARQWAAGYAKSRHNFLERLNDKSPMWLTFHRALVLDNGRWVRRLVVISDPGIYYELGGRVDRFDYKVNVTLRRVAQVQSI